MTLREDMSPVAQPPEPLQILANAVLEGKVDAESLERLSALVERHEDRKAAKEFAAAMAEFRRRCPEIMKASPVRKRSGEVLYHYVKIHHVQRICDPILEDLGLSYWWDSETEGNRVTTVCHLEHTSGHSREARFTAPNDQGTDLMSGAQKAAAGKNFARRQTLIDVLGVTTADVDDDAAPQDDSLVSREQAASLLELAESVGADVPKFCAWMRVNAISEILARDYDRAVKGLKAKVGR